MDIVIAIVVVGVTGLVAGIILALASHFMAVKVDEKYANIRECLPGANCGACGYTGCDGYAAALADGSEDKTNLCVPGADAAAKKLSDIMGTEFADVEEQVAFVKCNGNCDDTKRRAEYDGVQNCKSAALIYGGPESCVYGCLGFGDCSIACPENAICMDNGIAKVDIRKCIGCGICTHTCPKHIISLVPVKAKTIVQCSSTAKGAVTRKECENGCIGCMKCQKVCEQGAVTVVNNLATIDYSKCNGCGACTKECPVGCIKPTDFTESYGAKHAM